MFWCPIPVGLFQVGPEGSGHFVKMVHNGIEYGDMQLICEAYHLMKQALGMTPDQMGQVRVWLDRITDCSPGQSEHIFYKAVE